MKLIQGEGRSRNYYVMDELERELYLAIESGEEVPTGSFDKTVSNALTRLRRNGFIENVGSKRHPEWVVLNANVAYKKVE